jgi:hypothetical protein
VTSKICFPKVSLSHTKCRYRRWGFGYLHSGVGDECCVEEHESDDLNGIPLPNRHERQRNLENAAQISLKPNTQRGKSTKRKCR